MSGGPAFDEALIRRLAALLEETGLDEIEIGEGPRRVRVARHPSVVAAPAPAHAAPPAPGDAAPAAGETPPDKESGPDADHPGAVASPMVGTLYIAPSPGEKPFVTVGGSVARGETMFIIEAMKTMNPVRAPRGGTVTRVLASNGSPVEYGQLLAIVE